VAQRAMPMLMPTPTWLADALALMHSFIFPVASLQQHNAEAASTVACWHCRRHDELIVHLEHILFVVAAAAC